MQNKSGQLVLVQITDNKGNLIKEVKRSRAQANFMAQNMNGVQIIELPKERRTAKTVEAVEPKKENAQPVKKDISEMGKIELTAHMKTLTDIDELQELAQHELKTIREAAEKRIKQLA
jgi:hypothetical protein